MNGPLLPYASLAYHHTGSVWHDGFLGDTVARALVWTFTARIMWHVPMSLAVALVVAAGVYLVMRRRRRASRER